jgi:cytochrome c-type biogenesis protein CcmF
MTTLALAIVLPLLVYGSTSVLTVVGVSAGVWVTLSSLIEPVSRALNRQSVRLTRAQWGMFIAHLGVGLFIVGASISSAFSVQSDYAVRVGDRLDVGGYELELRELRQVDGPNYVADEGVFEVRRNGEYVATLRPQKRVYWAQPNPMTEARIDDRLLRHVFVAIVDPLGDGAWSVHVQYRPLINLIWYGCGVMALGGLLAATDRRYRERAANREPAGVHDARQSEAGT